MAKCRAITGLKSIAVALVFGACAVVQTGVFAQDPLSDEQIESRLKKSVTFLASDELEGRGIDNPGIDKAAEYIANQFREIGLETQRYGGTPFHTFYVGTRFEPGTVNQLTFQSANSKLADLAVKVDFTPLSPSGSGKINAPVAFVGYGITAPALGYDDYANLDVKGHVVIVIRSEPRKADPQSPFAGNTTSEYGVVSHKITNAIEHGASAVILVTDHAAFKLTENGAAPEKVDPLMAFQVNTTAGARKIPVVHCRRQPVDQLLRQATGSDLAKCEAQIDADLKPQSQILKDCRISGEVTVVRKGKPLKNVVAVLPGTGPLANETIVVGAHYDHLGWGTIGSLAFGSKKEIHNGADDNGSGTASLLEVARQLKLRSAQQPLPRQVVFVAFSAEESGLIGSERYLRDPLVPIQDTVAMLNMDMVGRLRNEKLTVYGTGTASEFTALVDRLATKYQFALTKKPGGQGPSDHASFYQRKIPVLHFFTGLHKQYHRPEDDSDLLNIVGMRRVCQMVVDSVEEIARTSTRPTYQKVAGGDEIEGLAEAMLGSDPLLGTSPSKPANKPDGVPYLGVSSKGNTEQPGYLIDKLVDQGPAASAGLRGGDVIVRIGQSDVKQVADVAPLIKKLKPGEKVPVAIKRNGVDLEVEVTIGGR